MYARRTEAAWEIETIGPAYPAAQLALRLDDEDRPHVAYYVPDVSPFSRAVYARREGTEWRKFPLERAGQAHMSTHVALAVGSTGAIHVLFEDTNDYKVPFVRYAQWNGEGWRYEKVVAPYTYGIQLSLQLGPDGQPRAAYCGGGGPFDFSGLGYAVRGTDGWVADQFSAGDFCSLALDPTGAPRISSAATSGRGRIILHEPGAAGWVRTEVAYNSLGGATSLALDGTGRPRIAYYASDYHDLMYAERTGARWRVGAVERSWQEVGYSASLALDAVGHPHIVAYTKGKDELVYWNFTPALLYLPMILN